MKEAISSKDREIHSLRRQLDAGSDELTEAGRSREVALRENRRLQDDLAVMTRENQVSFQIIYLYVIELAGNPRIRLFQSMLSMYRDNQG